MKSNYEIAKEDITGKWGNGSERYIKLKQAGYNPDGIQSIVNAIMYDIPFEPEDEAVEQKEELPIITGNDVLEVNIDLTKYKGINLTFTFGEGE